MLLWQLSDIKQVGKFILLQCQSTLSPIKESLLKALECHLVKCFQTVRQTCLTFIAFFK